MVAEEFRATDAFDPTAAMAYTPPADTPRPVVAEHFKEALRAGEVDGMCPEGVCSIDGDPGRPAETQAPKVVTLDDLLEHERTVEAAVRVLEEKK